MKNNHCFSETSKNFGKRLKYLRQVRKMTQDDLAHEIGLSIRQLRRIELGEATPQFSTMDKICSVLDVNILQLFMFSEKRKTASEPGEQEISFGSEEKVIYPSLVGVWSIDRQSKEMEWTHSIYEFLEYSRYSVKPTLKRFLNCVHPQDKQELKNFIEAAVTPDCFEKILIRVTARKSADRVILIVNESFHAEFKDHGRVQLMILDMTELLVVQHQLLLNKEQLEQAVVAKNMELGRAVEKVRRELDLRQKAEKKALESEAHFRFVAENSPVALVTLDTDMNVQYVSQRFVDLFGYGVQEISCPEDWMHLVFLDADLRRKVVKEWNREINKADAAKTGIEPLQYQVTCKDGAVRYVEFRTSPPGDLIVVALIDITRQKAAEQSLLEREAFTQLLMNLAKDFINISLEDIDSAISELLKKIGLFVNADRVYIFEHDHEKQFTVNTYEWCAQGIASQIDNLQATSFDVFKDILKIHKKGEAVYIPEISMMSDDHRLKRILLDQEIISLLLVPLNYEDKNLGFVGFDSIKAKKEFSESEIQLLNILSEIVANIMTRKKSEKELAVHKMAIDSAIDGIAISDMEGKLTYVNPAFIKMWGFESTDSVLGKYAYEFWNDQSAAKDIMKTVLSSGSHAGEMTARRRDGRLIEIRLSISIVFNHNLEPVGMVASFRDITESKEYLKTLHDQHDRLQTIIDATNIGTWEWDYATGEMIVNEHWANMIGYALEELEPPYYEAWIKLVHPDDRLLFKKVFNQHAQGKSPDYEFEFRMKHKAGHWVWIQESGKVISYDLNGNPVTIFGVSQEITERKNFQIALEESESRFRNLLASITTVAVQGYDQNGITQYWNKASEELYGYTGYEALGKSLLDLIIPPEMKEDVQKSIMYMVDTGRPIPSSELVLKRKDGSDVPVFSSHAVVKKADGRLELFCLDVDLT